MTTPGGRKRQLARGGGGRFVRTPDTAERDAEACRLRAQGVSFRLIADQLGFLDASTAYRAVERALTAIVAEPAGELRTLELERLDLLLMESMRVLRGRHPVVSNGRVMVDPATGETLLDPMPRLHAVDRILKIGDHRAKLLGLYAPTRVEGPTLEDVAAQLDAYEREIEGVARETA